MQDLHIDIIVKNKIYYFYQLRGELKVKKFIFCIVIISIFFIPLFAQEEGDAPSNSKIDGSVVFRPVRQGDNFIKVGPTLGIPLFNTSPSKFAIKPNIWPGGTIDVSFGHYVLDGFSLGATISFQFYPTLAKNLYFAVPITFDMAYTFAAGKWRFPLGGGIGAAVQSYSGNGARYFGMFFRFDAGTYYQISPEWSFGGGLSWSVVPEWRKEKVQNRTENFLGINLAVRYHL